MASTVTVHRQNDSKKIHQERHNKYTYWKGVAPDFGWLTRKSDVSLNTKHIPGIKNVAADMLSGNAKQFDMNPTEQFEKLFALFPQTAGYEIYQPDPKLLSAVCRALQKRTLPDRLLEKMQKREIDVERTLGSFVNNPV